jgi:hypothetical protein
VGKGVLTEVEVFYGKGLRDLGELIKKRYNGNGKKVNRSDTFRDKRGMECYPLIACFLTNREEARMFA